MTVPAERIRACKRIAQWRATAPEQPMPEQAATEQPMPEQTAPEQTAPELTTPEQTAPEHSTDSNPAMNLYRSALTRNSAATSRGDRFSPSTAKFNLRISALVSFPAMRSNTRPSAGSRESTSRRVTGTAS